MNNTPIYYPSSAYAREHDELEQYRESHRANRDCRYAIEDSIEKHFDGMHLPRITLDDVLNEYTIDRVAMILAITVRTKAWDGRFSRSNKEWAQSVKVPGTLHDQPFNPLDMLVVNSHPAILDGFVLMVRRELDVDCTC